MNNNDFLNDYFENDDETNADSNIPYDAEEEYDYDEEYGYDEEHTNKVGGKTFTKGFLTALAVCIVAVGAAVWTTINNVNSYLNPEIKYTENSDTDMDAEQKQVSSVSEIVSDAQVNAVPSAKINVESNESKKVKFTVLPVKGKILTEYSENPVYNETFKDFRAHPAIDYVADVDTKVRCMAGGKVCDVYKDDMLGYVVAVKHSSEIVSYYCGLGEKVFVQKGDEIKAGDFVGMVYAIPCETADKSHVHIEVKKDGEWINPTDLMVIEN